MQYENITDEVTAIITGLPRNAYIENGMVVIKSYVPIELSVGTHNLLQLPDKYAPRLQTFGFMSITGSGSDIGKVANISISPEGIISCWVASKLNFHEPFTIQYPLKRS